jgi:hypothetical protein
VFARSRANERLLQDQDRGLFDALASDPNARQHVRDAAEAIASTHRALAVRALELMRGDDLPRARRSFSCLTAAEMQELHGPDQTRAQVLADLEAHDAAITAAIAWVRAAPQPAQEPVAWYDMGRNDLPVWWGIRPPVWPGNFAPLYAAPTQPAQEPVGDQKPFCWATLNKQGDITRAMRKPDRWMLDSPLTVKLYAASTQPAQELVACPCGISPENRTLCSASTCSFCTADRAAAHLERAQ